MVDRNFNLKLKKSERYVMEYANFADVVLQKCIGEYESKSLSDEEKECIKNYSIKFTDALNFTELERYAMNDRPAKLN